MAATWAADQAAARAAGMIRFAVIIDGKTRVEEVPRRPLRMPEPMTRNLTEADWDEIGLLWATASLKYNLRRDGKHSP